MSFPGPKRCVLSQAWLGSPWSRAKLSVARDRDGIACVSVSHDHDDSADLPFGLHHRINCGSCLIVSPWLVFLSGCDTISDSVVVMYVHVLFPCRSREDFVHIPVEFLFVRWSILFSQRLASNCQRVDKNYAALHVSCSLVKQTCSVYMDTRYGNELDHDTV
jgi:hypothetical protein